MANLVFMDLDDTVISTNSFNRFIMYIYGTDIRGGALWNLLKASILRKVRLIDSEEFKDGVLRPLQGISEDAFEELCASFALGLQNYLVRDAVDTIREHQESGDHIVLITGALYNYSCILARALGIMQVAATRIEVSGSRLTGKIVRPELLGEHKAYIACKIANSSKNKYEKVIAYSDSITDLPLLCLLDHGFLINYKQSAAVRIPNNVRQLVWR